MCNRLFLASTRKGIERMHRKLVFCAGLLATAMMAGMLAPAARADAGSDAIITGRQAGYDLLSAHAGAFKRAVEGGEAVKPLADAAKAIGAWGRAIPGLFPPGTDTGHNTKALPAVWSDRAGFEKSAAALVAASDKLVIAANADDKAAFADGFKEMSAACGACHKTYRAK
jgi:cytochrome c556